MGKWSTLQHGFLPTASIVQDIWNGDNDSAFANLIPFGPDIKKAEFTDPADKVKGAYDQAIASSQSGLDKLQAFMGQGRDRALGYYKPLQQMFDSSYGKQGIAAPQVPQGNGMTLNKMFGGGK